MFQSVTGLGYLALLMLYDSEAVATAP